jgi:hypothetical protein
MTSGKLWITIVITWIVNTYGVTKNMSDAELKENLISSKIDYYFIWGDSSFNDFLGEIVYQNRDFRVVRVSKN